MPNQYPEPVGEGALWIKTSKVGNRYLSGEATFLYNGHSVTTRLTIMQNTKKQEGSKQPDYKIWVNDAHPAKPKEIKPPAPPKQDEEDIPF